MYLSIYLSNYLSIYLSLSIHIYIYIYIYIYMYGVEGLDGILITHMHHDHYGSSGGATCLTLLV